jgi:copper(I)-binding protein
MKPARLLTILAPMAALALAACQQQAEAPVDKNPDAKPGLSASDGMLVLPAVKGNPAAAYFTLANGDDKAVTLAGVSIDAAESAEMHESKDGKMGAVDQVELAPGAIVKFAPGGMHVMAFNLKPEVAAGNTVEMTLTFADGDKLSTPLAVKPAGSAMADHGADH